MKLKNRNLSFFICTIFCFLISTSCGLRKEEESFSNPLIGTWYLQSIKCYIPDYQNGSQTESYNVPNDTLVEMVFGARTFTYAVTESAFNKQKSLASTCLTSAQGGYNVSFTDQTKGTVDYNNLTTSEGCTVDMSDSTVGTVSVPLGFSALSYNVEDIFWEFDNSAESLIVQNSSNFFGSTSNSYCDETCYCYGLFSKNN